MDIPTVAPIPTKDDPALGVGSLCRALAPYNGGVPPHRSTIYRALHEEGLPVAGIRGPSNRPWFLLSLVAPWWMKHKNGR